MNNFFPTKSPCFSHGQHYMKDAHINLDIYVKCDIGGARFETNTTTKIRIANAKIHSGESVLLFVSISTNYVRLRVI